MKYTPQELQTMAQIVLEDRARGGLQSVMLILDVSARMGLEPNEVHRRIKNLAKGEFDEVEK